VPLCEWGAKTKKNQTFALFRPFIQKEFIKHHKHNKATAKSVGHGIANTVMEAQTREADIVETTVMAVAEIANVMQQKQDEQFDKMLKMFKTIIDAKNVPTPTPPNPNPNGKKKEMCPHCKMEVSASSSRLQCQQATCELEKQVEYLRVHGGQVHRTVATR
jgi:hypothetical protein